MAIRVIAEFRDIGNKPPVRREGRHDLIMGSAAQPDDTPVLQVQQVQTRSGIWKVAIAILLEKQAVNYDGAISAVFEHADWQDTRNKRNFLCVRRPVELGNAVVERGQLLDILASQVDAPQLIHRIIFRAGCEERKVFAIRAPARRMFGCRGRCQTHGLCAIPSCKPDVTALHVRLRIHFGDRVRDPQAVGRDLRPPNVLDLAEVVDCQATAGIIGLHVGRRIPESRRQDQAEGKV